MMKIDVGIFTVENNVSNKACNNIDNNNNISGSKISV